MQDKVKVTKRQKEQLDYHTGYEDFNPNGFLREHAHGLIAPENQCLNELSVLDMARCLLIGYEVEMTEEEQLLEAFDECPVVNGAWTISENIAAYRDGISTALNILGKKVPGINE
ncbi:hypothetical protein P4H27_26085 [Paenibacillus taichungensis]|uniref:hypothetical protein n=1 Tax=Paenibacillus taichungensis TaxID=484184 RepID=UPI002DB7F671|nr:hypothetical protein [Paenibacillus taichungensis]MEC0110444.1 hypothetical protein [Paenibacillus taichungensis]MEC0200120.1 hypothetical protein [Paenibacillus taichungensis]